MKKKVEFFMVAVLILTAVWTGRTGAAVLGKEKNQDNRCIVIDAGHGSWDPGKIGVSGSLEKDINLSIAWKLKSLLETEGYEVIMTRTEDDSLSDNSSADNKAEDMRQRCSIIEKANPVFTVSIHQNSYTAEEVRGAQVFYYGQSEDGAKIASAIQKSLIKRVDPENHRVEKANESYYLLKKTSSPTIIVECGFLSNTQEEKLLNQEEYQNEVAWAVYMGILIYLNCRN